MAMWCFVPGMKPDFWEGHLAVPNNLKANCLGAVCLQLSEFLSKLPAEDRGLGRMYLGSMACARTDEGKRHQGTSIFLRPVLLRLSLWAKLHCLSLVP